MNMNKHLVQKVFGSLIAVGYILVMMTTFREIALSVAVAFFGILIWMKLNKIYARQEFIARDINEIKKQ